LSKTAREQPVGTEALADFRQVPDVVGHKIMCAVEVGQGIVVAP